VFSDDSGDIVDFEGRRQVAKPLKLMILMVLSKINKIHLCSDTKTKRIVAFSSVLLQIVLFFSSFVLDCVCIIEFYSILASFKDRFMVQTFRFSQSSALCRPWF